MKKIIYTFLFVFMIIIGNVVIFPQNVVAATAQTITLSTPTIGVKHQTYNSVSFDIEKVSRATSYVVYRSEDNKNFTKIGSTTDLIYTDKNLVTGRTYYYQVEAINSTEKSYRSAIVQVEFELTNPEFSTEVVSATAIVVNINPVPGATKYYVRLYDVWNETKGEKTTTSTKIRFDSVPDKRNLYVEVKAIISTIDGDVASELITSSRISLNVPEPVVEAKLNAKGEIKISIKEAEGITKYSIYREAKDDKNGFSGEIKVADIIPPQAGPTTYIDKSLTQTSTYRYRVDAYSKNSTGDEVTSYSRTNYVTPLILSKPTGIIKKATSYYDDHFELNITSVDGANGYEAYEIINGEVVELGSSKTTNIDLGDLSWGSHRIAIRSYFDPNYYAAPIVYSPYTYITYNNFPTKPKLAVSRLNFNQNKISIALGNQDEFDYNDEFMYVVYRSLDNKNYVKVKTLTDVSRSSITTYTDTVKGIVPGQYVYYKVVIKLKNGVISKFSNVKYVKALLKKPLALVNSNTHSQQVVSVDNAGYGVTYEFQRSAKKTTGFKTICRTTKKYCTYNTKYNTYNYYRVRAITTVKGKKYASSWSKVAFDKIKMLDLDRYPMTLVQTNDWSIYEYKAVIKSVTVTKKTGNKWSFKINYKSKWSNLGGTGQITLYFYNYNASKRYTYTFNEKFKKGTKKNVSTTYNITLPSWATVFYIN